MTRSKTQPQDEARGTVLIVDDHHYNLGYLVAYLQQNGFRVCLAASGEEALDGIARAAPDVILLDVVMPGMSGYETCMRLKGEPSTREIPVVFVSGLSETQDKVLAFAVGAVDYVTKPMNREEVLARLSAHASLRRLRHELEERNLLLEERQRELAERNEELSAFNHMVAHDLRGSLTHVLGYVEMLLADGPGGLESRVVEMLERIRDSTVGMAGVIESLLLLAGIPQQKIQRHPVRMGGLIERVKRELHQQIVHRRAEILERPEWPVAIGFAPWIERVWFNYINNALKYGGHPPRLELGADVPPGWGAGDSTGDRIRFWVRDNGPGIPERDRARIFKPFTRCHGERIDGHGLGLSIVQRIATKLGGEAGVTTHAGGGSEFYFSLPGARPGGR